jgi:hypothetical protein
MYAVFENALLSRMGTIHCMDLRTKALDPDFDTQHSTRRQQQQQQRWEN